MEASAHINLDTWISEYPTNVLIPEIQKNGIFKRAEDRVILLLIFIIMLFILIEFIINVNIKINSVILIIVILYFIQFRNGRKGIYYVTEEGLNVPYFWFSRKLIPFSEIVRADEEELIEKNTEIKYIGLKISLDTVLGRYNISGLDEPNILLSSRNYDQYDLQEFTKELKSEMNKHSTVPNTVAQRLSDQVDRAWTARNNNAVSNSIDAITEFIFYFFLLELLISSIFKYSLFPLVGSIVIIVYLVVVMLYHFSEIPSSIIGIRPHELGPLLYNEADLQTIVRFIVKTTPDNIELLDCSLLFEKQPISQVSNLTDLFPKEIESGQLIHAVARYVGNQSKAIGVIVKFKYNNLEQQYEIPIYWD